MRDNFKVDFKEQQFLGLVFIFLDNTMKSQADLFNDNIKKFSNLPEYLVLIKKKHKNEFLY